ncbi:polysaccharide deacetylase family protein [Bacillus sp. FJAT-45350]|uniref:polysaccharide deacetylase family protein n=1 Tax=Bacillus sp. FJAT-45350 TaxID=2011014 RepID=UPI0015C86DB3|nr:polysaccharide deacetylase family protein [Bacillus sp. FJAT-45350]
MCCINNKKILFLFCIGLLLNFSYLSTEASARQISNERSIYAYEKGGVTLIPITEVVQHLSLELKYNSDTKETHIYDETNVVTFKENDNRVQVKSENKTLKNTPLPSATKLIKQTLYVPVRLLTDHFSSIHSTHIKNNGLLLIQDERNSVQLNIKPITSSYQYSPKEIKVLMYHHFKEDENSSVTISPQRFKEQLKHLKKAGYETITDEDIIKYWNDKNYLLPKKPLLLTIDDGYLSNYEIAYPILKEEGLKASIYVVTSTRGQDLVWNKHFTWEQAREMERSKVISIQSHGHDSHSYIEDKKGKKAYLLHENASNGKESYEDRVRNDLLTSKKLIEEKLEKEVLSISYPYGAYNKIVSNISIDLGYELELTLDKNRNTRDESSRRISRINASGEYSGEDLVSILEN